MYDYDSKDILYVWSKTIYTVNFNVQIVSANLLFCLKHFKKLTAIRISFFICVLVNSNSKQKKVYIF